MKKAAVDKKMSKSEFIRSQPRTMPAKAVVLAAKDAGMAITLGTVHSVRYADKIKREKARVKQSKLAHKKKGARPKAVKIVETDAELWKKTRKSFDPQGFADAQLYASFRDIVQGMVRSEMRKVFRESVVAVGSYSSLLSARETSDTSKELGSND